MSLVVQVFGKVLKSNFDDFQCLSPCCCDVEVFSGECQDTVTSPERPDRAVKHCSIAWCYLSVNLMVSLEDTPSVNGEWTLQLLDISCWRHYMKNQGPHPVGPWMSVQNVTSIHLIFIAIFKSGGYAFKPTDWWWSLFPRALTLVCLKRHWLLQFATGLSHFSTNEKTSTERIIWRFI